MITVELERSVEERLKTDAEARGITAEQYVREILEGALRGPMKTGQQIVRELEQEGILGAWKDRPDTEDAQAYARALRERVWTRERPE